MITPQTFSPETEREALEAMIQSDGWQLYLRHLEQRWGADAMETELRASKQNVTPEEWPFESTRILDTFAAMRANLRWPVERVRALKEAPTPGKVAGRMFDQFRRTQVGR